MGVRLFAPRESSAASEVELRRGSEAAALLLFALAVYLMLALLSLRMDPVDRAVVGDNWVGPVGAALASVLVRGFGVVAWAFPIELVLMGAPLFRRRRPNLSGLRVAGDLVILIVACALVHVLFVEARVFGAMPVGGNVGLLFGELFAGLFSTLGSLLVGCTIVGLILIGRSSWSVIECAERLVGVARWLLRRGVYWLRRAHAVWEQRQWLRATEEAPSPKPLSDVARQTTPTVSQPGAWVPLERTGEPPEAVGEALRARIAAGKAEAPQALSGTRKAVAPPIPQARDEQDLAGADAEGVAEVEAPEAPARMSVEAALSQARGEAAADEAGAAAVKIVDTRQNIEVERAPKPRDASHRGFVLPDTDLLEPPTHAMLEIDRERVLELAQRLEQTLADYGVVGTVEEVHPGPTVTTYEVVPQAGTKVSKVAGLSDDLALGLSRKVRIIAPIPGKARIGFELPNDERVPVNLRELIEDQRFGRLSEKAALPVVLGRDIVGAPFYADLASMPHVIVAGATGAGKSVGLNVMLSSLLFRRSPDELRLLMIDPKVVELAPFDGIPHLLLPVVTDMKQAAKALKWAVDEMERRYQAFASAGTKNISTYNRWADRVQAGELSPPSEQEVTALAADGTPVTVAAAKVGSDGVHLPGRMPHIVLVVDEFADLMMQQGKEVEAAVARLAQKARAAGMHVVLATQRPSVDVITGMIKANFPTRIAFRVAQKVDSRTILDEMGAELLLGRGDMLVKLNGSSDTRRVQCPFVSEEEVTALTDYLRQQGTPVYHDDILKGGDDDEANEAASEELDARFDEAVRIVADTQRCSTSWLQRKMTIGYNRAAKIVEAMEARGIVGPANGSKDREVYVQPH